MLHRFYMVASFPDLLQLKKETCLMQRRRGFGHGVVVSKNGFNILIVLLCDYCRQSF